MRTVFRVLILVCTVVAGASPPAAAAIFGSVRGIVHDPQHRPVPGATVVLKARASDWSRQMVTDANGEFRFAAVPVGDYTVTVSLDGFDTARQEFTVISGSTPVLHVPLDVAAVTQSITVSASPETTAIVSATPTTIVGRDDIAETPGADRTNSLTALTSYVPGAYAVHDQLHVRGGHQVSWLVDGVPIPNTNIASNVGPQFDPKDIDYLEIERGSYDAEYGDRTYGVFNVVPRTGFERDNEAELVLSAGSFGQTNDQASVGGHTERFAYYVSGNGNRSSLGLETPVADVIHDRQVGGGVFTSLIFNVDPTNQLRIVASGRHDAYQIPNTPDDQARGIDDSQRESDALVNLSWVRTFASGALLTVSPFYHYNSANYEGGAHDFPIATTDQHASSYGGAQVTFGATVGKQELQVGFYGFHQQDDERFGLAFNDRSNADFTVRVRPSGNQAVFFAQDKVRPASWLTVTGGVRQTHFSGSFAEDATSPRVSAAVQLPSVHWTLRGFYGRFYQGPPLVTASGPLLDFVTAQDLGFVPLKGERDEEYQIGVALPLGGWVLDVDRFQTTAANFFDHNSVGNSNVFFPLTIDGARIRGFEATLRSPRTWRHGQVHVAYSNQHAEGRGAISGGLTDFQSPVDHGYFPLDHDQRNTLSAGFVAILPRQVTVAGSVYYGSGVPDDDTGTYLSDHATLDASVAKGLGKNLSLSLNVLNMTNRHLLVDNSLTFGGTHFNSPREVYVEARYRFHY